MSFISNTSPKGHGTINPAENRQSASKGTSTPKAGTPSPTPSGDSVTLSPEASGAGITQAGKAQPGTYYGHFLNGIDTSIRPLGTTSQINGTAGNDQIDVRLEGLNGDTHTEIDGKGGRNTYGINVGVSQNPFSAHYDVFDGPGRSHVHMGTTGGRSSTVSRNGEVLCRGTGTEQGTVNVAVEDEGGPMIVTSGAIDGLTCDHPKMKPVGEGRWEYREPS